MIVICWWAMYRNHNQLIDKHQAQPLLVYYVTVVIHMERTEQKGLSGRAELSTYERTRLVASDQSGLHFVLEGLAKVSLAFGMFALTFLTRREQSFSTMKLITSKLTFTC